jgi:hypothetical protein
MFIFGFIIQRSREAEIEFRDGIEDGRREVNRTVQNQSKSKMKNEELNRSNQKKRVRVVSINVKAESKGEELEANWKFSVLDNLFSDLNDGNAFCFSPVPSCVRSRVCGVC